MGVKMNYRKVQSPMDQDQCDVSILVVGYNSARHLDACMGSIAGAIGSYSHEVLFVNNGTDDSEALVADRYPDVLFKESKGNIGFAAANNYLARQARGRWLLLLNPDTELTSHAIDNLLDVAERHVEYVILGGLIVAAGDHPQSLALLEFPSLSSIGRGIVGRASRRISLEKGLEVIPADAVSGAFLLVRHETWINLGGMDSTFFLYSEEMDLCRRAKLAGNGVGLVPSSRVHHDTGSGDIYAPARMQYQMMGNAHFYRKHFSAPYAWACLLLHWISALTRFVLGGLLIWRDPRYGQMSKGFRDPALRPWSWMGGYRRRSWPTKVSG
jgi:N-acetylglucosaminyl-diphospho-decaprenol L-rhamnosyltransferase